MPSEYKIGQVFVCITPYNSNMVKGNKYKIDSFRDEFVNMVGMGRLREYYAEMFYTRLNDPKEFVLVKKPTIIL